MLCAMLVLICSTVCWGVAGTGCSDTVNITVVYNCIIWPDQDWMLIIQEQLKNLASVGLAERANVHVVMSIPYTHSQHTYDELENMLIEGRQLVASILPARRLFYTRETVVSQVHENSFEYPGLHLLWLLAQVIDLLKIVMFVYLVLTFCVGKR